jgi:hypothetical protein
VHPIPKESFETYQYKKGLLALGWLGIIMLADFLHCKPNDINQIQNRGIIPFEFKIGVFKVPYPPKNER